MEMKDRIKKSYEKINISDSAKNRIKTSILMNENTDEKHVNNIIHMNRWKAAVAACLSLTLVLPTGVYAAQKIYQYFTTSVKENAYSVDMKIDRKEKTSKQQYIKLSTDFGEDYKLEKETISTNANSDNKDSMVCYDYKGGFSSGKCFWYELQYLDGNQKEVLSNYDTAQNEMITIGGRKAVYCDFNDVVGSKYSKDHSLDYGQTIYIFLEDYGYILEMAAQKGLPKDDFIRLAEKIKVEKVNSKDDASGYILYSKRQSPAWNIKSDGKGILEVVDKKNIDKKSSVIGKTSFELKDVKILDSINSLNTSGFIQNQFSKDSLTLANGKLKKYDRELIENGDGITTPERKVVKTEKIQPKLVYVTLEVDNSDALAVDGAYAVPSLQLISKKDGKIYKKYYDVEYNRPQYISQAFIDCRPCYFEENTGGKSSWEASSSKNKITLHFAYLVDEDQIDGMALCLNDYSDKYIDISQK